MSSQDWATSGVLDDHKSVNFTLQKDVQECRAFGEGLAFVRLAVGSSVVRPSIPLRSKILRSHRDGG